MAKSTELLNARIEENGFCAKIVGWVEAHSADTHRGKDGYRGVYPEPCRRTQPILHICV
jgi:hypothetical protein